MSKKNEIRPENNKAVPIACVALCIALAGGYIYYTNELQNKIDTEEYIMDIENIEKDIDTIENDIEIKGIEVDNNDEEIEDIINNITLTDKEKQLLHETTINAEEMQEYLMNTESNIIYQNIEEQKVEGPDINTNNSYNTEPIAEMLNNQSNNITPAQENKGLSEIEIVEPPKENIQTPPIINNAEKDKNGYIYLKPGETYTLFDENGLPLQCPPKGAINWKNPELFKVETPNGVFLYNENSGWHESTIPQQVREDNLNRDGIQNREGKKLRSLTEEEANSLAEAIAANYR